MAKKSIDFIHPSMPSAFSVIYDYLKIVRSNRYTNFGEFEKKFCENISDYYSKYDKLGVVTVSNATQAIHISILNIFKSPAAQPYVLLPSFTFSASAAVLKSFGYSLVFYDINANNLQPNAKSAKDFISKNRNKIAGIIYCNTLGVGNHSNFKEWSTIAGNIPIIVDSAAGFGSTYETGDKLGILGSCEIFSFHATKTMSIGEGGVIITKDLDLAKKLKMSSNFGFNEEGEPIYPGTNSKLQEINCAIGIRQLKKVDKINQKKLKLIQAYKNNLDSNVGTILDGTERSSNSFLSLVLNSSSSRETIQEALKNSGIPTRNYYNPLLHTQKLFKHKSLQTDLESTINISKGILSLPLHIELSISKIKEICRIINSNT